MTPEPGHEKSLSPSSRKAKSQRPLFGVAKRLEEAVLNDTYFQERNLCPDVDFYSGIVLRALGVPTKHVYGHVCHRPAFRLGWIS
ncbi:MAG: citrate/2-methylcitrate synthase [Desulfobacteraceae bacterium]